MAPSVGFRSLLLLCFVASLICGSSAQACKSQNFANEKTFETCLNLPVLDASLHWTYSPSNGTLSIAYWATPAAASDWVAWAINPTGTGMIGSQAIVGYVVSGKVNVITTSIESYGPSMKNGSLSFPVSHLAGESSGKDIILFATLSLQIGSSTVNQVWQSGPMSQGTPSIHPLTAEHRRSVGTLHLLGAPSRKTPGAAPVGAPSGGRAPVGAPSGGRAPVGAPSGGRAPVGAPSTPTSGGVSKMRSKNVTFLANSFAVDLIVLLSVFVFYLI